MTHREDLLAWFDRNFGVDVPEQEPNEWYCGFPDTAEGDIGLILFERLDKILATAEGIRNLYWEDREQFSFKTDLVDGQEIFVRFREAFRQAL